MKKLWLLILPLLFAVQTSVAQTARKSDSPPLFSDSRTNDGSTLLSGSAGKSYRKGARVKRNRKSAPSRRPAARRKQGLFTKKNKSDCDCPGNAKAKRKKRRG